MAEILLHKPISSKYKQNTEKIILIKETKFAEINYTRVLHRKCSGNQRSPWQRVLRGRKLEGWRRGRGGTQTQARHFGSFKEAGPAILFWSQSKESPFYPDYHSKTWFKWRTLILLLIQGLICSCYPDQVLLTHYEVITLLKFAIFRHYFKEHFCTENTCSLY